MNEEDIRPGNFHLGPSSSEGLPPELLSIRVKTMDSSEHLIEINALASVLELKQKLEEVIYISLYNFPTVEIVSASESPETHISRQAFEGRH